MKNNPAELFSFNRCIETEDLKKQLNNRLLCCARSGYAFAPRSMAINSVLHPLVPC